jgi:hypothetical protein
MNLKINSINLHISQYDPLFPSFDPRKFWERAFERNSNSSNKFKKITDYKINKNYYLELFKLFNSIEFIKKYK